MAKHAKPQCQLRKPPEEHDLHNAGKPTWQKSTDGTYKQLIQVKHCSKCDYADAISLKKVLLPEVER